MQKVTFKSGKKGSIYPVEIHLSKDSRLTIDREELKIETQFTATETKYVSDNPDLGISEEETIRGNDEISIYRDKVNCIRLINESKDDFETMDITLEIVTSAQDVSYNPETLQQAKEVKNILNAWKRGDKELENELIQSSSESGM